MKNNYGLEIGNICHFKHYKDYFCKIEKFVMVDNKKCAEILYSTDKNFNFAIKKTFALHDLFKIEN